MEYTQSEITKMLNTLRTREFYNKKFGHYFMSEESYDRLKKRYSSRPPFVFFFNPTIQLQQFTYGAMYYVGYRIQGDDGVKVSTDFKF